MKKRLSVPYSEAFEYFLEERQQTMMQQHTNLSHNVVRKLIKEEWEKLDQDKVQYYEKMHELALADLDKQKETKKRGRSSKPQQEADDDHDNNQRDQMKPRSSQGYSKKGKDYYRVEIQQGSKKFIVTPFSVIRDNGKRVSMADASQSLIDKANKVRKEQRDIANGVVKPFQEESEVQDKNDSEEEIQHEKDNDGRYKLKHKSKIYHVGEKDVLYNGTQLDRKSMKKRMQALYRKVKELRQKYFKIDEVSQDEDGDESAHRQHQDKPQDQTYEIKVHKPSDEDEESDEDDEDDSEDDEQKTQQHPQKNHNQQKNHDQHHDQHHDKHHDKHHDVHHDKHHVKDEDQHDDKHHHNQHHENHHNDQHDKHHSKDHHEQHHDKHHNEHHPHQDDHHGHKDQSGHKSKKHHDEDSDDREEIFTEMHGKHKNDRHHNTEGAHKGHKNTPENQNDDESLKPKRGRARDRKTSVGKQEKKLQDSHSNSQASRLSFLIRYAKNCQSRKKGYSIAKENISHTWRDSVVEEEKSNNSKMFDIFMRDGSKEYKIWSCAEGDPILKNHQVDELISRIQQYEKNH